MPESSKRPVVVLVHSRKGGVGKTTIALSAAIQLATRGKKVAFLELDTLGNHLAQVLPTDRDFKPIEGAGGMSYRFDPEPFQRQPDHSSDRPTAMPEYRDRPNYAWHFPLRRRGYRRPEFAELETRLVIADAVKRAFPDPKALETMRHNLILFLAPTYLTELSVLNDLQLSESGQAQFRDFLSIFMDGFARREYDYVVLDNSPGINFLAANVLAWALEWIGTERNNCQLWYVNTPAWWDMGLTLYESNVYAHLLERSSPTFIVNRTFGPWLGVEEFQPGRYVPLNQDDRQALVARIIRHTLFLPVWQAGGVLRAPERIADQFLPPTTSIAVLSEDVRVRSSMLRPEDEPSPSAPAAVATPTEPDEIRLANKFVTEFLVPAVDRRDDPKFRFHLDVRSALLKPLAPELPWDVT